MTTALIYLVVMVLVAAVVFLLASILFGRGEELPALPPGASPTRLPESGVTADDLRTVRFQQVVRGYKMSEVDWVLDRVGTELDELRARVAELESELGLPEPAEPPARAVAKLAKRADAEAQPADAPAGEAAAQAARSDEADAEEAGPEQAEAERR